MNPFIVSILSISKLLKHCQCLFPTLLPFNDCSEVQQTQVLIRNWLLLELNPNLLVSMQYGNYWPDLWTCANVNKINYWNVMLHGLAMLSGGLEILAKFSPCCLLTRNWSLNHELCGDGIESGIPEISNSSLNHKIAAHKLTLSLFFKV